jgi:hypothetical protein
MSQEKQCIECLKILDLSCFECLAIKNKEYKTILSSMKDENFMKCWLLENLRPYSSKQNLLDGNRRLRQI